jgi:hypothetical protein
MSNNGWITHSNLVVVDTVQDVLAMYHDLFLYGEVPLTIKVRTALRGWPLRTYLMWVRTSSNVCITLHLQENS